MLVTDIPGATLKDGVVTLPAGAIEVNEDIDCLGYQVVGTEPGTTIKFREAPNA